MSKSEIALEVDSVWKVFGATPQQLQAIKAQQWTQDEWAQHQCVAAVQNASFTINKGEVFVIMGLSGSGKSTLLRCLTSLIEPTMGKIILKGIDVTQVDEASLMELRRKYIGMVFQNFALLPNRTVFGNIAFPLEVQNIRQSKIYQRVHELIELVGLSGREDSYPSELSGGQQQRIGIARSLATAPEFWFLDEPFSALDPLIRTDLQDEVMRLQTTLQKTAVFVTHDLDEAIRIADRIAIMESGKIIQIGTAEELVSQPATDYVRRFVAKIHPARVVSAARLMISKNDNDNIVTTVSFEDSVESFAELLICEPGPIGIHDSNNNIMGVLDSGKALKVLAGQLI